MLASAHFLSRHYAGPPSGPLLAAVPIISFIRRPEGCRRICAFCGVYQKIGNPVEQVRFALWLHSELRLMYTHVSYPGIIEDQSIYWAMSGWDLGLLLDAEVPIEELRSFPRQVSKGP